jgi:uncharacterized DUF497 family protein
MEFEYDRVKSEANRRKHGIDFVTAQALWLDPWRVEVPAQVVDEERWMVIGRIGDVLWSAVITYRNAVVRIISVRRSRKEEVELYEG